MALSMIGLAVLLMLALLVVVAWCGGYRKVSAVLMVSAGLLLLANVLFYFAIVNSRM